jgi:hypothetical protein
MGLVDGFSDGRKRCSEEALLVVGWNENGEAGCLWERLISTLGGDAYESGQHGEEKGHSKYAQNTHDGEGHEIS